MLWQSAGVAFHLSINKGCFFRMFVMPPESAAVRHVRILFAKLLFARI
jgi:hypothetical protein